MSDTKKKKRGLTNREPTGLLGRIAAAITGSSTTDDDEEEKIAAPMLEKDAQPSKDDFADWDDDDDGEVTIVSFSDFD